MLSYLSVPSSDSVLISGRFIAFDKFQGLTNPREPIQMLFVEMQDQGAPSGVKLLRVVYYPETTGVRGGAKFLTDDILRYKNIWKLKFHQPLEEREKRACGQFDNFFRTSGGAIDTDGREPLLRYRSTQFDADIKFEKLGEMPCMVLDSVNQK
jgi:hypothetical protein